jgi:hypothetical protein
MLRKPAGLGVVCRNNFYARRTYPLWRTILDCYVLITNGCQIYNAFIESYASCPRLCDMGYLGNEPGPCWHAGCEGGSSERG